MEETSEMVERVARALANSAGARMVTNGQSVATREFGWDASHEYSERYVEAHWKEHAQAAVFAIEAMRGPTEAMVVAGCRHENLGDMAGRFDAMIDAALSSSTRGE